MAGKAEIKFAKDQAGGLIVGLAGSWRAIDHVPSASEVEKQVRSSSGVRSIQFDASSLAAWDGGILPFLLRLAALGAESNIPVNLAGLPVGIQKLFKLATAVPERKGARRTAAAVPILVHVGNASILVWRQMGDMIGFVGEETIGLWRLVRRKARFRRSDLLELIQACGAQALPIVSLISVLMGLVIAFEAAQPLEMFGAQIFIANMIGLVMIREFSPIFTAIIFAGRSGSAFAAEIGTMKVNEELNALETMGLDPLRFLVIQRVFAGTMLMPVLAAYSMVWGVLGGIIVMMLMGFPFAQIWNQLVGALGVWDVIIGISKSFVFGAIIAGLGCLRGMQTQEGPNAVGDSTTRAVVAGILMIILVDAVYSILTYVLHI